VPTSAQASIAARFRFRRADFATAVVSPDGALDLGSAPRLKRTLAELASEHCTRIVIDLSRVTFMDSTALGVLVGIRRRLGPNGVLAVAAASPQALALFELTGLNRTIQMFPTVDAATTSLRGAAEGDPGSRHLPVAPLGFTGDAAVVLGIASTAMSFADSRQDQIERWLRTLRRHGEAGIALASLGFTDDPAQYEATPDGPDPQRRVDRADGDEVAEVTKRAHRIAAARGTSKTRTADLLAAVIDYYGRDCERALTLHGVQSDELLALLEVDIALHDK
jgi:anti-sigma B factor antagonist